MAKTLNDDDVLKIIEEEEYKLDKELDKIGKRLPKIKTTKVYQPNHGSRSKIKSWRKICSKNLPQIEVALLKFFIDFGIQPGEEKTNLYGIYRAFLVLMKNHSLMSEIKQPTYNRFRELAIKHLPVIDSTNKIKGSKVRFVGCEFTSSKMDIDKIRAYIFFNRSEASMDLYMKKRQELKERSASGLKEYWAKVKSGELPKPERKKAAEVIDDAEELMRILDEKEE